MRLSLRGSSGAGWPGGLAQCCWFIEVRCSDQEEHRRRLEGRERRIDGFPEPPWESVQARGAGFDDWPGERLVLDSMASRDDNLRLAVEHLAPSSEATQARRATAPASCAVGAWASR